MTTPSLPEEYRLVELDQCGSSNDEAKRLASLGALEGTLVWAHRQTAGKGRRGREWTSERGNLFTSIILRPDCAPLQAVQLTFAAALAVRDTVALHIADGDAVACKWPNDVLVNGRKISGILLESSTAGKGNVEWLVLGVGINLRHHPDVGGRHPSTSLYDEGGGEIAEAVALEEFSRAFSRRWREWRDGGFQPIHNAWLEHAYGLGEMASIKLESAEHEGRFIGIDESGALRLKANDCGERLFSAGDVTFSAGA
ncbi:MAG: biotin--[acetyl-CoA-carboxylase] ligase [Rhodospirillaceae bacterium]|jgi:BirA family transcriptional regulator, biotin operon repressor / biotin---[acetyl-CoA-carboxylase] ligase|nr:biotin--[acetyl-CoA-carboxylase] ligase [Rhodospirillaceae bacterium]MBT3928151.1 biotin--[acetyl-CoA-carboxylase] ligase [Rhodospirillaceae bacterium]MBT4427368.1 biotin--[acetyl-CoA-carboxylase] ligase [Rhodospirillaceae bacterium]MBT5038766.1 biotin--[acetyl-CoA-carboxylase] ligase [Rhodospirillaceae bacterium]MBT5676159.1 biotin--[acetyl-CoA-carboxylase] ligase [Rhodospirillaceae bacterium]